jgi:hypothetical protein
VLRTAIKHLATDAEKYWDAESWIHHGFVARILIPCFERVVIQQP